MHLRECCDRLLPNLGSPQPAAITRRAIFPQVVVRKLAGVFGWPGHRATKGIMMMMMMMMTMMMMGTPLGVDQALAPPSGRQARPLGPQEDCTLVRTR